jgi:hypothetical protein
VLYYQSRIYFNMFNNRKDSDGIGQLLGVSPEKIEIASSASPQKKVGQCTNSKQSGSSHPNNSTNTHLHNANFSESSKPVAHQSALKRDLAAGPSIQLKSDERQAPITDFQKKE